VTRSRWLVLLLVVIGFSLPASAQAPFFKVNEFAPEGAFSLNPPGTNGPIELAPGQENTLDCGFSSNGGGILCSTQFTIVTTANSTGLSLNVRSDKEFVVFVRFGTPVTLDQGRPSSDLTLQSRQGQVAFALPPFQVGTQFPGLQAGRYFLAIAHFEQSNQHYRISGNSVEPQALSVPSSAQLTCSPIELICLKQFSVRLDASQAFTLNVSASGEFLALIRLGQPVQLPELTFDANGRPQIGTPIADLSVSSQNGRASLRLDANSSPPLQRGTYFVALTNLGNLDAVYTLDAALGTTPAPSLPQADFDLSPAQPRVGQPVSFTDNSSAPGGRLASWAWDFGDGGTSALQNPSHAYAAPGTYRVQLVVSDDAGQSATAAQTLTVQAAAPPPLNGVVALAFSQLALVDPAAWQRRIEQGCVVYANVSDAEASMQLLLVSGQIQTLSVRSGDEVIVCGNVAHVNP